MVYSGIKSFEVENYKSVKYSGQIDITGIAVVLGANSSGKTNLLEPLLLLRQSMDERGLNLTLNGKNIKLGEYSDVVHNHDINEDIRYRFNLKRDEDKENEDKPLECPICGKMYKESGWYKNHIKNKHDQFWEYTAGEITEYEEFPPEGPYLEISFSYNKKSKSNQLDYIKFGYPEEVGALYLSYIKLLFSSNKIRFKASDINNNLVVDLAVNRGVVDSLPFANYREIEPLFTRLLGHFQRSDRHFYPRYSKNQPYVADQVIPTAEENQQEINNILRTYSRADDEEVNIEGIVSEQDELAKGLISRLGSISELSSQMVYLIDSFIKNISHIGPLRRNPQRIYFGSGGPPQETYSQGVDIEERIFRNTQAGSTPIIEKTNDWLKQTGFDCEIEIEELGVGDIYQLKVIEDEIEVNLADSGFGLSQALPILVECINMGLKKDGTEFTHRPRFRASRVPNQYLTIIEEPEIHLNPRIESAMADFFIDINENGLGFILETHSEHILNRIQRRIADGTIKNKDSISVYFVSKEGTESQVKEIKIDENGTIDDWPSGFFQEDFDDAVEMLKESFESEIE